MRRIIVTGAAGYVGGPLCRLLLEDPDVHVVGLDWARLPHGVEGIREILEQDRFSFHRVDVRDVAALRPHLQDADAVVHLAAVVGDPASRLEPALTREINVEASKGLIDEAGAAGVRHLVFISTCSNYGVSSPDEFVTEDAELRPLSLYAETKVEVERALEDAPVPSTRLRFSTVYGVAPRMRFDLTVNQFAAEAWRDRRLAIYGAQYWRPYLHVEDAARAVVTVLSRPDVAIGRTYNVGDTGENYTKGLLYELLATRIPGLDVEWVDVAEDPRSYRVDFSRIRDELGFEVSRRVPEGVDQVLAYLDAGAFADFEAPRFRNDVPLAVAAAG